eukprot:757394-Hanusia_phi.AAC.1
MYTIKIDATHPDRPDPHISRIDVNAKSMRAETECRRQLHAEVVDVNPRDLEGEGEDVELVLEAIEGEEAEEAEEDVHPVQQQLLLLHVAGFLKDGLVPVAWELYRVTEHVDDELVAFCHGEDEEEEIDDVQEGPEGRQEGQQAPPRALELLGCRHENLSHLVPDHKGEEQLDQ